MLNKAEIKQLIEEVGLIQGYMNLEKQITPNGFDLTVEKIFSIDEAGSVDFSNNERVVPLGKEIAAKKRKEEDKYGCWNLPKGVYKIKTNETVKMPNNLTALAFTRTTLLRMGALTQNGVWDAGFKGKSEFVLIVENPAGVNIKQNARIIQLVFLRVEETEEYNGVYKHLK